MTNTPEHQADILRDRYALKIAARLSDGCHEIPYEVTERLRAARTRAVAGRKRARAAVVPGPVLQADGTLGFGRDEHLPWWGRLASVLPVVTLVVGLFLVTAIQDEYRAQEIAEIDSALLVDDLPPTAYADPGFVQFLKMSANGSTLSE